MRIVHGPCRLVIATDNPMPTWAWTRVADLATDIQQFAAQLDAGEPDVREPPLEATPPSAPPEPEPATHADVATIARDAIEHGQSPYRAVADRYGLTVKAAESRVLRARAAGEHIPRLTPGGQTRNTNHPRVNDYEAVARAARTALEAGTPMWRSVAVDLGVDEHRAIWMIEEARRLGLLERPATRPRGGTPGAVDYDEVARIVVAARAAGRNADSELASRLGITRGAASQRRLTAERRGLLAPCGAPGSGFDTTTEAAAAPEPAPDPGVADTEDDDDLDEEVLAKLAKAAANLGPSGTPPPRKLKPVPVPQPSRLSQVSPPLGDDEEAEPLTWGVHGESPPKVEHWSRREDEE